MMGTIPNTDNSGVQDEGEHEAFGFGMFEASFRFARRAVVKKACARDFHG